MPALAEAWSSMSLSEEGAVSLPSTCLSWTLVLAGIVL